MRNKLWGCFEQDKPHYQHDRKTVNRFRVRPCRSCCDRKEAVLSESDLTVKTGKPLRHRVSLDDPRIHKIPRIFEGELFSSYLERLARDNCFDNAPDMMKARGIDIAPPSWNYGARLRPDGFSHGTFTGFSIHEGDIIMAHTTLAAYSPMMSRSLASRYIRQCASTRHGKGVLSNRPAHLIDVVRTCPECESEATYVHREHNVSGVSVCWKHGCPLVEKITGQDGRVLERQVPPGPHALQYARFVKAFLDADLKFCLQDLLPAFRNKVRSWESKTGKLFISMLEAEGFLASAAGIEYVLRHAEPCENAVLFEEMLTALMVLFDGNADAISSEIRTGSSEARFMKAIEGRFVLESAYDERIVRLRCLKCGMQFPTTPHSILSGWGCPKEDDPLSDAQLFGKLFDYVNDGYELLDYFRNFQYPVNVRHIATGKIFRVKPDRFLNFPHEGLLGRRALEAGDIRAEVERYGLTLESIRRGAEGIMLGLYDGSCDERFSKSLRSFRRNPECGGSTMVQEDAGLSAGAPHSCRERAADAAAIRTAIAGFDGVFFLEDIRVTDKRFTANTVSRLARNGLLRHVDSAAYCRTSLFPTFRDIMDAKFVVRHGIRRGFHCGNTMLKDMGLAIDDPVPTVVTMMADRAFNTQNLNVCGQKVRVIKSHVPITEDNWKALAVLFMLRHLGESDAVDKDVMYEVLSRWMGYENIGFADLVPFRDEFTARIFNDAVMLLRRIA